MKKSISTSVASPTCVTTFSDNQVVRMTTWSANGRPDLRRGIKLAHAAYESRTKRNPPAITKVHFEIDGVTIATYTADQIAGAVQ